MCGINGFSWRDEKLIRDMNYITRHRGPDDEGLFIDDSVSLGHRRLSIIDLSCAGHQPMTSEDGSLILIYNGEIYNSPALRTDLKAKGHVFTSSSDTEVIIHGYEEHGEKILDMLNGMWAFCLYDKRKKEIFISRDRYGIKPLYYWRDGAKLAFSSMIGALLKHNVSGSPNERAVMQYLAFNLLEHNSETFFKNIQVLLPGHYIRLGLQDGKFELKRWYTPQRIENVDTGMIRDLFHESVRLRMLSDVPIGSCLSGGIDSTAIVSLLNKHCDGKTFKTFSFTAPGSSIDESKYMREAGKAFRAEQHFTTLSEDDFINSFEDFTGAVEEPVTGLSVYAQYTVMRLAKENGAKVLFDGQGSDEIFAGYIYYFSYLFYEMLTGGRLVGLARENIECVRNFKNLFPQALFVFMLLPARLKKFFFHATICDWVNFSLLQKETSGAMDPRWNKMTLQQILETTLFSTAIPHLLNWEDKNSMRWSVESRVPFLDHHLVEAAMSMPAGTKLKNGVTKAPFREAVSDLLPEMIRARKDKIGFAAPDDEFLRSPKVSAWAESVINSPSFKSRPYWDWAAVDKNHKKFLHCKNHNIGGAVFKWLSLEIWLRKFFG